MPVEHSLPFERSLFIVTPNAIHLHSQTGAKIIFECESTDGIINARVAANNSSLLAVTDSQIVVLHDTTRIRVKKHKLKGGDATPRLLLFSPDSRTLFFTTTLNTSIQAYSLPTGDLLPSFHSHPSPPNVVAISNDGDVLLSASPSPPTILLQNRRWAGLAAVNFKPTDTSSALTCAAFQAFDGTPQSSYIQFVLGFKDGILAMYKVFLPSLSQSRHAPHADQILDFQLQPVRVGAMSKLHKAAMGGVTAAAFIPGYKSRVVSIGHDGRCRLVDFEATSLSVTTSESITSRGRRDCAVPFQGDAADEQETAYEGVETLVAVGTQAGKVLVFNVLGLMLHEIVMNVPITSVEWIGDMSAPSVLPVRNTPLSPEPGPVIKALMEVVGEIEIDQSQRTVEEKRPSEQPDDLHHRVSIERPTVSFSDKAQERTPDRSAGRLPNVSQASSSGSRWMGQWPRTNISARSQIETTKPGSLSTSSQPFSNKNSTGRPGNSNISIREARRWPQIKHIPVVASLRARRARVSKPSSHSSRRLGSSDQDFFTPPSTRHPSTREDKGKGKTAKSMHNQGAFVVSEKRHKPLRISSGDSSSLSEHVQSNKRDRQVARSTGRLDSGRAEKSRPTAAATSDSLLAMPSTEMEGSRWPSVSRSLYSQPASNMVQNRPTIKGDVEEQSGSSSRKRKLLDISPAPTAEASSSHDLSSSLYSRPKSRVFRGHSKALDGGADAATPILRSPICGSRKSFSFDAGLHDLEALAEQRYTDVKRAGVWTGGKREEISRLCDDNAALKRQISDFRHEFRMLKDVLLQAESHWRWQECVS
ncbi:hypothetical protein BU25DRAFT_483102 [Macroventuria anomochaeta]|uniref:Uncharacterized protein n=1 Tax=Macroventuria anomochaeta TaxID=301207 RepID=A0ACB6RJG1_9PLEO|nr:uncharacterized protein BU25DRAFT_483102 [Macroventuria anomochaeta]KAF2621299.1 hypothetical protein BU25DRAFT_483102 [Macroventuria anomochaeta]